MSEALPSTMDAADIWIIVPAWNTRDLLAACLASIPDVRLGRTVVVDNGSSDGTVTMLRDRFPAVRVVENPDNLGFARAVNQGAALTVSRYVLFLNSDAILEPGAIEALAVVLESQPQAGLVGSRLLYPDGSFQASFAPFPTLLHEFLILSGVGRLLYGSSYPSKGPEEERGPQTVDYVGGACMLARRSAFEQVGGFDEGYFLYAEEVDLCHSLWGHGWDVWYQPAAVVLHAESGSSRSQAGRREAMLYRSRVRFFRKHRGVAAANILKAMIFFFTAAKIPLHAVLRFVSGGRLGREVVAIGQLVGALRGV
jgi:hypothetical protein